MASLPLVTVLEQANVSPPSATVVEKLLSLTFFDFLWLTQPPIHNLFFYELSIDETQFVETIIPSLKNSLSITLQHFYPFAGNLILFPDNKKPEIRYVEGDFVSVTFAKSSLDFNDLVGNHPRDCDQFYDLIPPLGESVKTSDFRKIPLFSVQATFFPQKGVSIGMTNHHSLGDASTRFCFLNAWTTISRSSTDESFLANIGTKPFYDRVINNPKLDQSYLKFSKIDTLYEKYQPLSLPRPSNKLRGTFILTRKILNELKKSVSTKLPTLSYVSSFTVACGYIWSCIAKSHNDDLQLFGFTIDCRARLDPPVPSTYFGNCVGGCMAMAKTTELTENDGFITAAKLLGESLHKTLTETGGIVRDIEGYEDIFKDGMPTTMIGVAGTPKLKFYDQTDFGWGRPKKVETISIDYSMSISMNACRESNDDLEIGVSLINTEMEAFVRLFDEGLKAYV